MILTSLLRFHVALLICCLAGILAFGSTAKVQAQDSAGETTAQSYPSDNPFTDDDQVQMMDLPVVRIRILNKITALTRTYNLDVNKAVQFDGLHIQPRACRKAPPIAQPESAAFLEIWETPPQEDEPQWIFSGWMFASSPGLSAMDHPVYDVWVLDCLTAKSASKTHAEEDTQNDAAPEESDEEDVNAEPTESAPAE